MIKNYLGSFFLLIFTCSAYAQQNSNADIQNNSFLLWAAISLCLVFLVIGIVLLLFNRRLKKNIVLVEDNLKKSKDELSQCVEKYNTELNDIIEKNEEQLQEYRELDKERLQHIEKLKEVLEVNQSGEILPICSQCKDIRDKDGYWHTIEAYIQNLSDSDFSHSLCPDCAKKLYPELFEGEAKAFTLTWKNGSDKPF